MPELPEVTITSEQLNSLLAGRTIVRIRIYEELTFKSRPLSSIENYLPLTIKSVRNKGKNIIFDLVDNEGHNYNIISHMMLTGRWLKKKRDNYSIVTFTLDNNSYVTYCDRDKLGKLDFVSRRVRRQLLADIKPSIFDGLDYESFLSGLRTRPRSSIFSILMDQDIALSGVGNYIANESLYASKIHPKSKIVSISDHRLKILYDALVRIINNSYSDGGVSVKDYVNVYGERGRYQEKFLIYGEKYDEKGHAVDKQTFCSRTIHFCNICQKH